MSIAILIGLASVFAVLVSALPTLLKYVYSRRNNLTISVRYRGSQLRLTTANAEDAAKLIDIWLDERGNKQDPPSLTEDDQDEGSQ